VPRRVRFAAFRFAARPGWLAGHLLVVALCVTMVLLGRWQLSVSNRKGFSLQNFGYALQWWAFTVFGILLWLKILRDHSRHLGGSLDAESPKPATEVETPVAYRRYVMPQSSDAPAPAADATYAAYNDYLARLAQTPPTASPEGNPR
jgi:DNA-binding transcriptional regulator of glucitol operon